ncbi:MAG: penicillin-binding protein 2 [Deferrisomatales bacterium]|nr:penicillin-binding protein 2 [Deferrisomatales bacterium]
MFGRSTVLRSQLRTRFLLCLLAVATLFGTLLVRLAYLQVIEGSRYRYLSENNRIRLERLPAPRGMILDRNGVILADVRASFDAYGVPAELPPSEQRQEIYQQLSQVLELPEEQIRAVYEGRGPARWKPRLLKRRLARAEMARLEVHRLELPSMLVQANPVRHYPAGSLLGNTLGYVGEISGQELGTPAYAEYDAGDFIGRSGLEMAWEGTLQGQAGGQQVEVDVHGRTLGVLAARSARPGRNLVLTIDQRLQRAAEQALDGQVGSVVALGVGSGDVLAMVSVPALDPNPLAEGMSEARWKELSSDPRHPLQNRPHQGVFPPGSTFKIAAALAGLAEGSITPKTQVLCTGEYHFAGRGYRCWKKTGHGLVDLERALVESCDVYFYQLGLDTGVDAIHRWASELGLGSPTGIDLPGENSGLLPSKAWKRRARNEPWYAGETLSISIGQGYVLATPLQLAQMIAAVANPQGLRLRPRIVARIEDGDGTQVEEIPRREAATLPFRATHLELVRRALRGVVAGDHGTGSRAEVEGFPVAGKTGTSQVMRLSRDQKYEEDKIPWEQRDHALFVCYAPSDDPEIAVAVVVEHAGHGGAEAAPVAQRVIEAYRELRAPPVHTAGVAR